MARQQDLIEGVIYLPENLFYNTTAPGVIIFLNNDKTEGTKGKTVPAQREPRVRQRRSEKLSDRRRDSTHR